MTKSQENNYSLQRLPAAGRSLKITHNINIILKLGTSKSKEFPSTSTKKAISKKIRSQTS
jgi:hypothetical protein